MIAIKKNWQLARRELLKGLGLGAACLPILQATKSYAQVATAPKRAMFILLTEGYRPGQVAPPAGPLASATLPAVTAPLEKHKNDLSILTNLGNPQFRGCLRWGHGTYGTIFAQDRGDPNTGNGKEYWEPMGPTIDQVIAKGIKAPPGTLPSLALGVRVGTNSGGTGSNRCFYSGPKQPITPEADPYKLFGMLFSGRPAGSMPDPAGDKLRAERKSLLDYVGGSLEKFRSQLGSEDRVVIEGHLNSIRNIEVELTTPRMPAGMCMAPSGDAAQPVDIASNNNNPALLNVGFQLMTAALRCDVTRVATLQFGDATGGSVTFPVVNVGRNWHSLGHNPGRRQAGGRQVVHDPVQQPAGHDEGRARRARQDHARQQRGGLGEPHGVGRHPRRHEAALDPRRQVRRVLQAGAVPARRPARTTPTSWPPSPTPWGSTCRRSATARRCPS